MSYLLLGGLTGLGAWLGLVVYLFSLVSAPMVVIAVPMLLFVAVPLVRGLANLERVRVAALLGVPVPRPYRPGRRGIVARYGGVLADPASWRDLVWLAVHTLYGPAVALLGPGLWLAAGFGVTMPLWWAVMPDHMAGSQYDGIPVDHLSGALLAIPVGVVTGIIAWFLNKPLALGEAYLARWLLRPTVNTRLAQRVEDLASSRAETVDARAAELRRIERDLHDGAQARLVSLSMSLGLAEEAMRSDPDAAARLLAEARGSAGDALTELRDLVRGIHPPVLADRGLVGALKALAMQSTVDVEAHLEPVERLPAPVESALYFSAAEALANVAKHSHARHAAMTLRRDGGLLCLEIRDDGRGGADIDRGGGLAGIASRIGAFDGRMTLSSPAGGPTVLRVEVPCES
ncbi:histidine kinase [Rugosimonospora africana]|uniref:histidine kinase n=1 Tax=Rugosimonospora africana TaxID=556532 RepID=A0A8J3QLK6_9ACTN|nr:histidine kinase [Rugosimonospora africana]